MRINEFIHRTTHGGFTVRVWAKVDDLRDVVTKKEQEDLIDNAVLAGPITAEDIAERVAKLPFCNAVEVYDNLRPGSKSDNIGVLIYPDWP